MRMRTSARPRIHSRPARKSPDPARSAPTRPPAPKHLRSSSVYCRVQLASPCVSLGCSLSTFLPSVRLCAYQSSLLARDLRAIDAPVSSGLAESPSYSLSSSLTDSYSYAILPHDLRRKNRQYVTLRALFPSVSPRRLPPISQTTFL